jgi:hypothetical protein
MRSLKSALPAPLAGMVLLLAGCFTYSSDPAGDDPAADDAGPTTSTTTSTSTTSSDSDGGTSDWQGLYAAYFASGTAGHCASCHASGAGGFTTGTSADSMYQAMISYGLIDRAQPAASPIGLAAQSILSWYDRPQAGKSTLDGRMPQDMPVANASAAAAVTAWVVAGAKNHGLFPNGSSGSEDAGATSDAGRHDAGGSGDAGKNDGGKSDSGAGDAGGTATWTALYTDYFGPNTIGHCGNSSCHRDSGSAGGHAFVCGSTKEACFQGLVAAELIESSSPASSALGDPSTTPLSWYGMGGTMPQDQAETSTAGANAVTAWLKAGALDN